MKKRGFTLVEVLAVIVILGFLIVLIVPTVNNLIKDSEDSLESRQISSIIAATKQYVTMNSDLLPAQGSTTCISLMSLVENGIIDNNIIINPKTKEPMNGCVIISYSDEFNQYEYSYSDSNISN